MAGKDYYKTLGIGRSASEKEIKQAYRKLARQYHPDVNPGNKDAEARFKEINAAHDVLADPEKRKKYDQYGENWEHADQFASARARGGRAGSPFGSGTGPFGFGGFGGGPNSGADIDLEELLGGAFGRGRGNRRSPRRGTDLETKVDVSLEEAFQGTTRTIQVDGEERCKACEGNGQIAGAACASCRGLGVSMATKRLEVKVPAGVNTGSRVRVAGEGQAGSGGGAKGDLYLVVTVLSHSRFERKDDDLHVELPVPLTTAVLGGEAELVTLKGKIALKVPAETQNGQVIRLAGLGMPKLGDAGKRGDLYAKVKAVLPADLTKEQERLFEELRKLGS